MQSLFGIRAPPPQPHIISQSIKHVNTQDTHVELNEFLLCAGGKAVPLSASQMPPAKMSVMLPSVNFEDCSQSLSLSTMQEDMESSGADTF